MLCACGCGEMAPIASKTDASTNRVKGRPMRFVSGHNRRLPLTEEEQRQRKNLKQRESYYRHLKRRRDSMRRRWHARKAGFDSTSAEYLDILADDPCSYCGGAAGEIDHIDATAGGGLGSWDNLTAACRSCNASKHSKPLLAYLGAIR